MEIQGSLKQILDVLKSYWYMYLIILVWGVIIFACMIRSARAESIRSEMFWWPFTLLQFALWVLLVIALIVYLAVKIKMDFFVLLDSFLQFDIMQVKEWFTGSEG